MIVNTQQASELLGVSTRNLSDLVTRGKLKRVERNQFSLKDIIDHLVTKKAKQADRATKKLYLQGQIKRMHLVTDSTIKLEFTSRNSLDSFFKRVEEFGICLQATGNRSSEWKYIIGIDHKELEDYEEQCLHE